MNSGHLPPSMRSVIHGQLNRLATMPPDWAERVFTTATRAQDHALMAQLASRADISVELLEKLAWNNDPRVRVAALSHDALPEETRTEILAAESRTSVLCPLLEADPNRYLDRAVTCFTAKPTTSLARRILLLAKGEDQPGCIGKVPESVMVLVAETITTKASRLGYEEINLLRTVAGRLLGQHPDLALACLQQAGRTDTALDLIGTPGLSAETRIALLESGLPRRGEAKFFAHRVCDIALHLSQAGDVQDDVIVALTTMLEKHSVNADPAIVEAARKAIEVCKQQTGPLDMLRAAAKAGSPLAVNTLLFHPEVSDAEKFHLILQNSRGVTPEMQGRIAELPLAVREYLVQVDPEGFVACGGLETFSDQAEAKRWILTQLISQEQGQPKTFWGPNRAISWVVRDAPELFGELPWDSIRRVLTRNYSVDPKIDQLTVNYTATLNPEAWETFLHLGESWQGTLAGLIETVEQL
jgi:hypothetical protein